MYYRNYYLTHAVSPPKSVTLNTNSDTPIIPIGSNVTLTCTVELSPAVDVPVTVNTVWTGPAGFMATNTTHLVVENSWTYFSTAAMVNSFRMKHSGNYMCTVTITSNNSFLTRSDSLSSTLTRVGVGEIKFWNIVMYMTDIKTVVNTIFRLIVVMDH